MRFFGQQKSTRQSAVAHVLVITATVVAIGTAIGPTAHAQCDGCLDTSFASDGVLVFAGSSAGEWDDGANAAARWPWSGETVIVGDADNAGGGSDAAVLVLDESGQPLTQFDGDGYRTLSFGSTGAWEEAVDVLIQPYYAFVETHRIVVLAKVAGSSIVDSQFGLACLLRSGALDTSFGTGGITTFAFDAGGYNSDRPGAAALQSDRKIVVAGSVDVDGGSAVGVARLTSGGVLDTTFGSAGRVVVTMGANAEANAVLVQPDGKIVIAGKTDRDGTEDFLVVRVNDNGTVDGSFGTSGRVVIPFDLGGSGYDVAEALALQPDGKILVAGAAVDGASPTFDYAIARLEADGDLDTTFGGGDGKVNIAFVAGTYSELARTLALQPDGKILVGGSGRWYSGTQDMVAARLTPSGELDDGTFGVFGTFGYGTNSDGSDNDWGLDLVLAPDGRVVFAGRTEESDGNQSFLVVRFTTDVIFADGFDSSSWGSANEWSQVVD